jgi:hypothetical protein
MTRAFVLVAVLLASLLAGMALCNDARQEHFFAGDPDCMTIPVLSSPRDSASDQDIMCRSACRSKGGTRSVPTGAITTGTDGEVVSCRCCDPASQVTLVSTSDRSQACVPNRTYGTDSPGSRTMFTSKGCAGIFKWGDSTLVKCENGPSEERTQCLYLDSSIPTSSMPAHMKALKTLSKAQQEAETRRREDARLEQLRADLREARSTLATVKPMRRFGGADRGPRAGTVRSVIGLDRDELVPSNTFSLAEATQAGVVVGAVIGGSLAGSPLEDG